MKVCLVAIAKDEGRFLPEWLAHYLALGVDQIFLFDNESSDATAEIVAAAGETFPVTRIPWRTPSADSPQISAYNHALQRLARRFDWACFFDCDEFLVLRRDRTVADFLGRFDDGVGAIGINWLTFGSSGRTDADYELVTETFRSGAKRGWANNKHIKTIARPDRIHSVGIHDVVLRTGSYVHSDGQPLTMPQRRGKAGRIDHSLAQINHYQIKSRADFDAKIRRGRAGKSARDPTRFRLNGDEFFRRLDRNEVDYDDIDGSRAARLGVLDAIRERLKLPCCVV